MATRKPANLADRVIKAIPTPATGHTITWDTKESRFGLRTSSVGVKTFILQYRSKHPNARGKNREIKIGRFPDFSATRARDKVLDLKSRIANGEDPLEERQTYSGEITLEGLVSEYNQRHLNKTKAGRERSRILENDVLPALGAKTKAIDVTRRDIIRLFEKKGEHTLVQANRVLSVVRSLYNWAADKEVIDYRHANPTRGIKKNPEKGRQRFLSNDEIADFWHKLPNAWWIGDSVADALKLILATGKRSGEVCGMKWDDIRKGEDGHTWWIIPASATKNDQEDKVTLNSIALEIIERRRQQKKADNEFVFPSDQAQTKRLDSNSLGVAVRRATGQQKRPRTGEVKNDFGAWAQDNPFTPHDLRRTVASHLQMLKVPLPVTKRILNHVTGSAEGATAVYIRYQYDDEARAAMARWSTKLRGIITDETQKVVSISG